ncbi:hypothetical protein ABS71_10375 [bacterium SCN 62-11]|nr:TetR/AcrR family transcriptional regulator [Candidatus Eremiobacteraeota bacterium]ODT67732.1 MAG: hypothetical protein ABS71_10375 [bacterium SCN 62-11]
MRVSREQAALNRDRIVECAARLFRERGFEGVGVDAVMREAGLTHGGFYGHFGNKEQLVGEACARAVAEFLSLWRPRGYAALLDSYLSVAHLRNPGRGCVLAALGCELARQSSGVQAAVRPALEEMVLFLGEGERERGLLRCSLLVGGLVLARNLDESVLEVIRTSLRDR